MNFRKRLFSVCCFAIFCIAGISQQAPPAGWHLLDKKTDGYQGISLQQAYAFLKDKKSKTVIVAVLDGGTDTTHEDLRNKLWRNPAEIAGNGKDDDNNGYADDTYGWNFLGNPSGENVIKENLEAVRVYHDFRSEFELNSLDTSQFQGEKQYRFALWQKANKTLELGPEERFNLRMIIATMQSITMYDSMLQVAMDREKYSLAELEEYQPITNEAKRSKFSLMRLSQMLQFESDKTNQQILDDLNEYIERQETLIYAKERPMEDYRRLIGDNHKDIDDKWYGNSDVMGGDAMHGTHVAGIIGASRNNGIGIDGVADNVQLMTLRVVPKGDEYDKDVALGIRYAVDNGAKILNMSFGKDVSPFRHWVEDAIKYAAKHDVLLVHAAGNEGVNLDEEEHFPTSRFTDNTVAANMITVGASGDSSTSGGLVASFTNYGKTSVDVLAPGVKIYSTVPDGNQYSFQEGTSMAAPVVSGIAAIIRGYFPELTAAEVKDILVRSVDKSMSNQMFALPGDEKKTVALKDLCISGGIVNARKAVELAYNLTVEKTALIPEQ